MQQSLDTEYIDMYDTGETNFWTAIEHIARYRYAAWFCKKRRYTQVLDIACSNGYGTNLIASKGGIDVLGVDINKKLIDFANKHAINDAKFLCSDIDKNFFEDTNYDKKFGCIVSLETIEHIEYPKQFVFNIAKALKNNGRIIISVPNGEFEPVDENSKPKNKFHRHVFYKNDLDEMFKNTGLEVEFILGQSMINNLMRKHNTYCSRNPKTKHQTTSNFLINDDAIDYYINMFAYPEKDDLESSYSLIYVLKHKK